MNAFAQAHKMTKEIIQAGDNYAATFALCLKYINQKANPMIDTLNNMIQQSQEYIARLQALKATNPRGYIVVTGSGRMPIVFADGNAHMSNIECATRYNDVMIAKAKARQVTNGAQEKGVAVDVVEQIDWEIIQQTKLIADLNTAKANVK